jgi:hypothetical protein
MERNYNSRQGHIDLNIPIIQEAFNAVRKAKRGESLYSNCHPDYFWGEEQVGNFPENIERYLWIHVGFQGSLSHTRSSNPEVHGLLQLRNNFFLRFVYFLDDVNGNEPRFDAHVYRNLVTAVNDMPPSVYSKYFYETTDNLFETVNLDSTIEFDYGEIQRPISKKSVNLTDANIDDTVIDEVDFQVYPEDEFSDMPPLIHVDDHISPIYLRRSPINTSKMFC